MKLEYQLSSVNYEIQVEESGSRGTNGGTIDVVKGLVQTV